MKTFILPAFLLISSLLFAGNPLVKDIGMSDPHVQVFNDTIYLFCGHDDKPTDPLWVMQEWRVFKTVDLINWEQVSTISTKDNYMPDNSIDCWAGDAATRNGKYYFYFSDQKRSIGVMSAGSPDGHYVDALGEPLVAPMHDPTILIDDDAAQTPYMVYGDKDGDYHVVRLNDDMISLAEKPQPIVITGAEWDAAPIWMDKNYIFKHKDTYYLSWGRDYAISKNIYGPYECVGAVGNGFDLDQYAHGSFFEKEGQFYHLWCYYIDFGFKYRETIMTYCHMSDDGKIVTDTKFLDAHFANGMGQYSAEWERIEAEWYTGKSDDIIKHGSLASGFTVTTDHSEDYLRFTNVDFSTQQTKSVELMLSDVKKGMQIELREGSQEGRLLANFVAEKSTDAAKVYSVEMQKINTTADVYVIFKGRKSSGTSLDWIKFLK